MWLLIDWAWVRRNLYCALTVHVRKTEILFHGSFISRSKSTSITKGCLIAVNLSQMNCHSDGTLCYYTVRASAERCHLLVIRSECFDDTENEKQKHIYTSFVYDFVCSFRCHQNIHGECQQNENNNCFRIFALSLNRYVPLSHWNDAKRMSEGIRFVCKI